MVFLLHQTQKSEVVMGTRTVYTWAQDFHLVYHAFLLLLTAFVSPSWQDTLSWFFVLESHLWIQSDYVPDTMSQAVTVFFWLSAQILTAQRSQYMIPKSYWPAGIVIAQHLQKFSAK